MLQQETEHFYIDHIFFGCHLKSPLVYGLQCITQKHIFFAVRIQSVLQSSREEKATKLSSLTGKVNLFLKLIFCSDSNNEKNFK